eukprot:3856866-Pyramimonas_sp.AAC.1
MEALPLALGFGFAHAEIVGVVGVGLRFGDITNKVIIDKLHGPRDIPVQMLIQVVGHQLVETVSQAAVS